MKSSKNFNSICENFIKNTMDFYDIPGIAVGVMVSDADCAAADSDITPYIFTGAGGYRNYETKDPLQADTVFHCTSVSKLFTAMGIMKLVEQGRLTLSDKLCDIVPWMSIADKRWEQITIGSMLTHTSGLTDVNDYHWEEHRNDENALKDYALSEEVTGRKLLWDPASVITEMQAEEMNTVDAGPHFRYSSMAYDLLGLVIAEVSGEPFEEFMEREIFSPLEMTDTSFNTNDRIKDNIAEDSCEEFLAAADRIGLAMPHYKGRDRVIHIEKAYPYTRQHTPSSCLTSTAADLLRWAESLMNSAPLEELPAAPKPFSSEELPAVTKPAPLHVECVLQAETLKDIWAPRIEVPDTGEQMGLGWFIRKQTVPAGSPENGDLRTREYALVGHEGSDDGFRTSFWMCPELGVATVLLCNLTDAPLKKLNKKLFELVVKSDMTLKTCETI